ncbi:MAG: hypothetical protein OHK0039_12890 [Bacteroidia bacterium]
MRRVILLLLLGLGSGAYGSDCPICGCAPGAGTLGILPWYDTHALGLWAGGYAFDYPGYETRDQFYQIDLWGRWYPRPRWQVMGALPLRQSMRTDSTGRYTDRGLGDATLTLSYAVLRRSGERWAHQLMLGGGIKLPTGARPVTDLPAAFAPGSGSVDALATLVYQVRRGPWGLSTQAAYRWNTANNQGYRIGDPVQVQTMLFYWQSGERAGLMPYAGMAWEYQGRDIARGYYQDGTGGSGVFAHLGADVVWKQYALGLRGEVPVYQHYGQGAIVAAPRVRVQFSKYFL